MRRPIAFTLALLALALLQALLLPSARAEPVLVQCRPTTIPDEPDDGRWSARGPIAGFAREIVARQGGWLILGFEPILPGPDWAEYGTQRWSCRSEPLDEEASARTDWTQCVRLVRGGLMCRRRG